jgi:hypothetical protein
VNFAENVRLLIQKLWTLLEWISLGNFFFFFLIIVKCDWCDIKLKEFILKSEKKNDIVVGFFYLNSNKNVKKKIKNILKLIFFFREMKIKEGRGEVLPYGTKEEKFQTC